MDSLLPFAFICLTSFFTLTNPLGTMPVFLSMTKGIDNEQRARIVKRATIVSFVILISFTVCGQVLFSLFGISTNGFRIAAGFIIMKIGFDMLQAKYSHTKLKDDEVKVYANDISITPLSIPMLCGPGAIANGIMLMENAATWEMKATLIGSIDIPHTSGVDTACAYTRRDGQQRHDASYGTDTYGDSRGVLRGRPEAYNG